MHRLKRTDYVYRIVHTICNESNEFTHWFFFHIRAVHTGRSENEFPIGILEITQTSQDRQFNYRIYQHYLDCTRDKVKEGTMNVCAKLLEWLARCCTLAMCDSTYSRSIQLEQNLQTHWPEWLCKYEVLLEWNIEGNLNHHFMIFFLSIECGTERQAIKTEDTVCDVRRSIFD